ncbi:MAG: hypothetical protein RR954_09100 [Christensenellaceae bacterium]
MRELFLPFNSKKAFLCMLALIGIHLVVAMPFKSWVLIPEFTDIRPVTGLLPVYGVFMGPIGGFATAFANLIEDALTGMLTWGSIAGFVSNLLVPYLYYKLWYCFFKKPFEVKTGKDLIGYSLLALLLSLMQAAIIAGCVYAIGTPVQAGELFAGICINNFFFAMLMGLPLIMVLHTQFGYTDFGSKRDRYLMPVHKGRYD